MEERLRIPSALDGMVWEVDARLTRLRMRAAHWHRELELNLVVSGWARYRLRDRSYHLVPGALCWLFPGHEHRLLDFSGNLRMYVAVFKQSMVRRCRLPASGRMLVRRNPPGQFSRTVSAARTTELGAVLDRLCEKSRDPERQVLAYAGQAFGRNVNRRCEHHAPELLNAGLAFALVDAWHAFEEARQDADEVRFHPSVSRALELLDGEGLALAFAEVAARSGLSSSRLSRLFHRQTGLPFAEYRNRRRVEAFLHCYGTGQEKTLTEAAYEAGFGSYMQFYRCFTRITGATPNAYRDRCRRAQTKRK